MDKDNCAGESNFGKVGTLEYYEGLIDFLYDMVPCLDDLIEQYNEGISDE